MDSVKHSSTLRKMAARLAVVLLCGWAACSALALEITLDPPGDREFVRDQADLIDTDAESSIREICDRLLTEKATPIIVVTIHSMAEHGGAGMRIETFATLLFDQWGVGQATLNGQSWNTGILLLVSRDDRKARIELGAGWGRREDAQCQRIMNEQIIPRFKQGRFSEGIVAGVKGLDRMARQLELPSRPRSTKQNVILLVIIGLAVFTVVSLIRRGSGGWAWLFWAAVFGILGTILYHMATSRSSGGGGFGGGFSGGGGATGSW